MTEYCCVDLKSHWNKSYQLNSIEKLGWFEKLAEPCLNIIGELNLASTDKILIIGSGATTLVDSLIELDYQNIIALDISDIALNTLKLRNGESRVRYIVDDITTTDKLVNDIMLWQDRAVLHFITDDTKLDKYKNAINNSLTIGGYALIATYALDGAEKCNGLPVKRYSADMITEFLGKSFKLLKDFRHVYTMPSGNLRPYTYTLFQKIK